jgi:hypothetical protein
MSWVYLVTAGLFEIGWPVGLKWAQEPGKIVLGVVVAVVSMAISGGLLFLAQKEIALGTAYAVMDRHWRRRDLFAGHMAFRRPWQPGALPRRRADHCRGGHAQARPLSH